VERCGQPTTWTVPGRSRFRPAALLFTCTGRGGGGRPEMFGVASRTRRTIEETTRLAGIFRFACPVSFFLFSSSSPPGRRPRSAGPQRRCTVQPPSMALLFQRRTAEGVRPSARTAELQTFRQARRARNTVLRRPLPGRPHNGMAERNYGVNPGTVFSLARVSPFVSGGRCRPHRFHPARAVFGCKQKAPPENGSGCCSRQKIGSQTLP